MPRASGYLLVRAVDSAGYDESFRDIEVILMGSVRRSNERGMADHGWLKSFHTFSFAEYFDPHFIEFGVLRVINEDRVQAGAGFGTHSLTHSEYNPSTNVPLHFLQIWIKPDVLNVNPSYEERRFA